MPVSSAILELSRLQKDLLQLATPHEQLRFLVDSVSEVVDTDVCTLYLTDEEGNMNLMASHGLDQTGPVSIPASKGLVGLVAKNKHPINVARANAHPNFFYVEGTAEERFGSFCGVPLVRYGRIIGVLVVQRIEAVELSAEDEGFLVTLSSQLAHIVADIPNALRGDFVNQYHHGVKGSSGIGIGIGILCDHGDLFSVPDEPCDDIEEAVGQWHSLLARVISQLESEESSLSIQVSESVRGIFNTYASLLRDPALMTKVEEEIQRNNWLPGALRTTVKHFAEMFESMEDPYMRARAEDIHHLGNKLYAAHTGGSNVLMDISNIDRVILIGQEVSVSDIATVPSEKLAGIICFAGSGLSHTAVLANALGVPAVMGVGTLKHLRIREKFIVDGNSGLIVRYPNDMLSEEFQRLINEEEELKHKLSSLRDLPAITPDGHVVHLLTNSGLLADLSPGLRHGAQGIGLYRTEIPFMIRDSLPSEEEQLQVYQQVFDTYKYKPVYMRTLDIGGDKQLPYFPIRGEQNPAMGWRGIRFTLDNYQVMMTQLRAMLRAAGTESDLHILLPMVSSSEELNSSIELLQDAQEQLLNEGYPCKKPKLGVMIEVPAAISLLPFWSSRIDFISIGSNDLSQYLLALDRNNAQVANRYDQLHPAVLQEIQRIFQLARTYDLKVSLCGEMASDPMAVILLVGMGFDTLSMSATKLPKIKYLLRNLPWRIAESLLQQCLQVDNVQDIRTLLKRSMKHLKLTELLN
jgi:phosphoenolpyruvate-protein phosphotransferase